jgi:hypothetical protein
LSVGDEKCLLARRRDGLFNCSRWTLPDNGGGGGTGEDGGGELGGLQQQLFGDGDGASWLRFSPNCTVLFLDNFG